MRQATVTEAKNSLSALLALVRAGETVVILERGIPIARLDGIAALENDVSGRLARLQRKGTLRVARRPWDPSLLRRPLATVPEGVSAVDAVIQERQESP